MSDKAVFFDRDKTILLPRKDNNYIYRVGDFHIPDEYLESLKKLYDNGYKMFIVTNQGRVAKGYLTEEDVNNVHDYLTGVFEDSGFSFEEFLYCPHNPEGSVLPYNSVCNCRKPKTGMLEQLIEKYDIDINISWMVGDSKKDIYAGQSVNLKTILLRTGFFSKLDEADYIENDLTSAINRILETNN